MRKRPNIYIALAFTGIAIGLNELWPNSYTQALVVMSAAVTIYVVIKNF